MTARGHEQIQWTYPRLKTLGEHIAAGLSFRQCARHMRVTRGAVAGAVRRYIRPAPPLDGLTGEAFRAACRKRQADYEESRRRWRLVHPIVAREDCE